MIPEIATTNPAVLMLMVAERKGEGNAYGKRAKFPVSKQQKLSNVDRNDTNRSSYHFRYRDLVLSNCGVGLSSYISSVLKVSAATRETYKSTALIAASGLINIPNEFKTVMNVPGAVTNRHGFIRYPTKHIIKDPRLTSIQRGASEARSMPAATEF